MSTNKKEKPLKRDENTHSESEDPYKTLINNMLDGVFQTDLEGNYTLVNKSYAEIYGYEPEEMYQLNTNHTWVSQDEKELVFKELRKRDIKNILKRYRRKDGSTGWLALSIRTKSDLDGKPIGFEGVARDATERKLAEIAQREASERAAFLIDIMVHDLNNINQGMMLPLELVARDPDLPLKHKKPVELAIAQLQRSTELIRNAKRLQTVIEQTIKLDSKDVFNEVTKAAELTRSAFLKKELELKTNFGRGETHVVADEFLTDLFFNLFHNSMKFDKNRLVKIEVNADISDNKRITITVTDYGSGIPDDEKMRVLLRKRGGKGSGMGLTLVKYLVERYNGTISLQDRVQGHFNQGTIVVMTFPRG